MKDLFIALLTMLPVLSFASGFYVPFWFEWLLFLTTPGGMVLAAVFIIVAAVLLFRRGKD